MIDDSLTPTQDEFDAAEASSIEILSGYAPDTMTSSGSSIRELLIRPFAYLSSWLGATFGKSVSEYSVSELMKSTLTENAAADTVAGNYFISRKKSVKSSGSVLLTCSVPAIRIHGGSAFKSSGATLKTLYDYYAASELPSGLSSTTVYVRMYPGMSAGTYMCIIPVTAVQDGSVEIGPGTSVDASGVSPYISFASVASAITGGKEAETDSEMMRRAAISVADSTAGSYYGIGKLLSGAGIDVARYAVASGEDKVLFRARENNTSINPGGMADVYVSTQKQPSSVQYEAVPEAVSGQVNTYRISIPATAAPGFYCVRALRVTSGGASSNIEDFSVAYGGCRLSAGQSAVVTFTSSSAPSAAVADLPYMPGIDSLQLYVDDDSRKIVGLDLKVKGATPVKLTLSFSYSCTTEASESLLESIRAAIAAYVNSLPVGTRYVNFSDIRNACSSVYQGFDLRVPCVMTAEALTESGARHAFSSTDGILDIGLMTENNAWSHIMSYVYVTETDVELIEV